MNLCKLLCIISILFYTTIATSLSSFSSSFSSSSGCVAGSRRYSTAGPDGIATPAGREKLACPQNSL